MPSVLFVCTGNQFRSPLAAGYFRRLLEDRGCDPDWTVQSAGIWAVEGESSPAQARAAAMRYGVDLSDHRAKQVTKTLLENSGLIVTMTAGQREAICIEFPEFCTRVHLLSELSSGLPGDILDPPSAPAQVLEIMRDVCELVRQGFPAIKKLAEQSAEDRQ